MNILGINAYHGDVSAVLLCDGELVAAVEEERFRRIKHIAGFPTESILACLTIAGLRADAIDHVAVSRNPKAHLWRKALFALQHRPGARLVRDRATNYSRVGALPSRVATVLGREAAPPAFHWVEHHPAHLASTFFVSPFDEAAICAIDGFGDFVSTSMGVGRGTRLHVQDRVFFPHSLGLLYLAVTQYLGFPHYGDEFKVMGLAPYGQPDFVPQLEKLVHLLPDGRFALDLSYFTHWSDGAQMTWEEGAPAIGRVFSARLEEELGPARRPEDPLEPRHEAIAASLQVVFEGAAFHILRALHARTRLPDLCLAGGCAMNSVANGKIRERTPFERIYIQPASGDNGTALGAAYYVWNHVLGQPRRFVMNHGYWGAAAESHDIAEALSARAGDLQTMGCQLTRVADEESLVEWTAGQIADGQVVGWFKGRM